MSRKHLSQWEDDLDACLMLSTQEMSAIDSANEFKDLDLPTQVIETQQQIMQSAIEQSEREYFEKAIEESIKSVSNLDADDLSVTEAALLDSAYQASLSLQEIPPNVVNDIRTDILSSSNVNNPSLLDPDMKLALELSQLNEDEILQRVLQESLNQQHSNFLSERAPTTSQLTASLREEEEMQEAIRMSMMNQYQATPSSSSQGNPNQLYCDLGDDPELEFAIQESYLNQTK